MECKAKMIDVSKSIASNSYRVLFELDALGVNQGDLFKYLEMDALRLKVVKWAEKRSLDANAYFHVLVGKIADVLGISKTRCKNDMITSYGQIEYIDDVPVVIKTNIPPEAMERQEVLHCKLSKVKEENGANTYFYYVYRGSHTYNTIEMAHLIDGVIADAKDLGIETMTPAEIERMKAQWQIKDIQSLQIN